MHALDIGQLPDHPPPSVETPSVTRRGYMDVQSYLQGSSTIPGTSQILATNANDIYADIAPQPFYPQDGSSSQNSRRIDLPL